MKLFKNEFYLLKTGLFIALIVGGILRLSALGRIPMGLHQDEAFSAYNAWCVMNFGMDSAGYKFPVYYTVYGSGMSVLYSYLTMPFIMLMGTTAWAIRLPQAILGCLSIYVIYEVGKELLSERFGVLLAIFLAINPWHIESSRFGWDCTAAVPMFLIGLLFLCRYMNGKKKSIWGAAVFFGLTLYGYALTWIFVPMFLLSVFILFRKRFQPDKYLVTGILLLFIMALPLLLFLLVNYGIIPEIRLPWISIPRLPQIRSDELSLSRIKDNFLWLFAMLWSQHDDMWWITNRCVGAYYYISVPFILVGIFAHLKKMVHAYKEEKQMPLHGLMFIWLFLMLIIGCFIDMAKFHKVNELHIPIIFYTVYGIACVVGYLKKIRVIPYVIVIGYMISFGIFVADEFCYPVNYDNYGYSELSRMHWNRYEDALAYAKSITEDGIGIDGLAYPNVLLYEKYTPYELLDITKYKGEQTAFSDIAQIGRYRFGADPAEEHFVYVFPNSGRAYYEELGYEVTEVTECYSVAVYH